MFIQKNNNKRYPVSILFIVLIILLGFGNLYFYEKAKKPGYVILIGSPTQGEDQSVGIDFTNSKPLSNRNEIDLLIFSLMDAISINKPKISQTIPDLTIWFSDQKQKILYYSVNVWFTEDSIIFESNQEQKRYKIIHDDRAEVIKKIIEKGS